jgi:response regulator of citrate/malate metabolism
MENIIVGFEYLRKIKHQLDGSKPSHEVQGRSTKKPGQQVFLMVRTLILLDLHIPFLIGVTFLPVWRRQMR